MRAPLLQGLQRRRLLDLTIASDILTCTKPHISEYSYFSLYLNSVANLFCAAKAFAPVIPSAE